MNASPHMPASAGAPIRDLAACDAWLAAAPLADPQRACQAFTQLLETLAVERPEDEVCTDILERLREPIAIAQDGCARRFAQRPLPLNEHERMVFDATIELWHRYGSAWSRLLQKAADQQTRTPLPPARSALLAQRALDCVVDAMLAHYRCRHELEDWMWAELHRLRRLSAVCGVLDATVPAGRKRKISSPNEVYNRALLLALANPCALSARELNWLRRWTTLWAFKLALQPATMHTSGHVVDTTGDRAPQWRTAADAGTAVDDTLLHIDTGALRRSLLSRLRKLDAGADPHSLGLGKDCVQPECARLLHTLLHAWTETPTARRHPRRPLPIRTELVSGLSTIHLAVGGVLARDHARHWDYDRRDAERLFIYHGVTRDAADAPTRPAGEQWDTLDESAAGLRLCRRGPGERLHHQQLVALKPEDASTFMLCEIRWLTADASGALTIGVRALPGPATAVSVRESASTAAAVPAFLLPARADNPATLVLPSGWSRTGRKLEMTQATPTAQTTQAAQTTRIRVNAQLHHGHDFDLIGFAPDA